MIFIWGGSFKIYILFPLIRKPGHQKSNSEEGLGINGFQSTHPQHSNDHTASSQDVSMYCLAADVDKKQVDRTDPYSEVTVMNHTVELTETEQEDSITGVPQNSASGDVYAVPTKKKIRVVSTAQEVTLMENSVYDSWLRHSWPY